MTYEQIERLIPQYGVHPKDPVLIDPWEKDPFVRKFQLERSLLYCPDPGRAFAERFAQIDHVPEFLDEPEYNSIRLAMAHISGARCRDQDLPLLQAVGKARAIQQAPSGATLLKAMLLTAGASAESVGEALGLEPEVVLAFNDLFYNVLHRKDDMYYLNMILRHATAREDLLHVGLNGSIDDVFHAAGYAGRASERSADSLAGQLRQRVLAAGVAWCGVRARKPRPLAAQAYALIRTQAEPAPQPEHARCGLLSELLGKQLEEDHDLMVKATADKMAAI